MWEGRYHVIKVILHTQAVKFIVHKYSMKSCKFSQSNKLHYLSDESTIIKHVVIYVHYFSMRQKNAMFLTTGSSYIQCTDHTATSVTMPQLYLEQLICACISLEGKTCQYHCICNNLSKSTQHIMVYHRRLQIHTNMPTSAM